MRQNSENQSDEWYALKMCTSLAVMFSNAVGYFSAQLVELGSAFVRILFLLPLTQHCLKQPLNRAIELLFQLSVDYLYLAGHLERVDAVYVVELVQQQPCCKTHKLLCFLLEFCLLTVIKDQLFGTRNAEPQSWIAAAFLPFFFVLCGCVDHFRIEVCLE